MTIASFALAILLSILSLLSFLDLVRLSYREAKYQDTLRQEEAFLRYTVDNMVTDIELMSRFMTEQQIEEILRAHIYRYSFGNGCYLWVNKILNLRGGDNYAIRLIHPVLKSREGEYLSTRMEDSRGNRPYELELERIRERGYGYFSYYYEKPGSAEAVPKLSYSRYCPKYSWVVGFGVYTNDIMANVRQNDLWLKSRNRQLFYILSALFVVSVMTAGLLILFYDRRHYHLRLREMQQESESDPLTGVKTRRAGHRLLKYSYEEFLRRGIPATVVMMDIDDFKSYNDSFGHDNGDLCLKVVAAAIRNSVRQSDSVIRYGGDEFVVILNGVNEADACPIVEKLRNTVRSSVWKVKEETIHVTISIGYADFQSSDHDETAVWKRADQAMYRVKKTEKNGIAGYRECRKG